MFLLLFYFRYGEVWLARWRGERVAVKVRIIIHSFEFRLTDSAPVFLVLQGPAVLRFRSRGFFWLEPKPELCARLRPWPFLSKMV